MELAALVLGSPRGRFFCANVAYTCSTDSRAARYYRPQNISDARLSLLGYLTTPGIAIPLSDGRRSTLLGGWDPDATFWLDPEAIDIDDEPTLWRRVDERWEQL